MMKHSLKFIDLVICSSIVGAILTIFTAGTALAQSAESDYLSVVSQLWKSSKIEFSAYDLDRRATYSTHEVRKGYGLFEDDHYTVWHTTSVDPSVGDAGLSVTKNEWPVQSLTDFQMKCVNAQLRFINDAKAKLTNSNVKYFAISFRDNQVKNPWYDNDVYQAPYLTHDNLGNSVLVVTPYENYAGYCKLTSAQTILDAISTTLAP